MIRKHKIFESGNYNQGEYSKERVKNIFSNVSTGVKGIYAHTSKWKDAEPVQLAEFKEISFEENDDKLTVFADIEFNEKGELYYNDGIISGVSVEIPNDTLTAIALLPVGVNPAVKGAEFEEHYTFVNEFEEISNKKDNIDQNMTQNNNDGGVKKVTLAEILAGMEGLTFGDKMEILKVIAGAVTEKDRKVARAIAYEFQEELGIDPVKEEPEEEPKLVKTEEEIRAEIKKEMETEQKEKEFQEKYSSKFPENQKNNLALVGKEIAKSNNVEFEFEEGNIDLFGLFGKILDSLPEKVEFSEVAKNGGKQKDPSIDEDIEAGKKLVNEIINK